MTSIALLIGNSKYTNLRDLPCCKNDVEAFEKLMECTGRFDEIFPLVNLTGEQIRDEIRDRLTVGQSYEEVVFYFTGHGDRIGDELYLCGSDYSNKKPNETGLSQDILHDLVRGVSPNLFTKILDACFAGEPLIKSHTAISNPKGFQRVVQFSSSLATQTSLAGESLSEFSDAFLRAAADKEEGPVYYTDIVNALRDKYLDNDDQTPFFISQGTARELLLRDASALKPLRELLKTFVSPAGEDNSLVVVDAGEDESDGLSELSLIDRLRILDESFVDEDAANDFIDKIFQGVVDRFEGGKFSDYFVLTASDTSYYDDMPAHDFMVRVLSKEDRPDNFVTAKSRQKKVKVSSILGTVNALEELYNPTWTTEYDLRLNCSLNKAQLVINLEPTTKSLQRLRLTLSVAPSLRYCYLFEILTSHQRIDWKRFESNGSENLRRWYKLEWGQDIDFLLGKITDALEDAIETHVEAVARRVESND